MASDVIIHYGIFLPSGVLSGHGMIFSCGMLYLVGCCSIRRGAFLRYGILSDSEIVLLILISDATIVYMLSDVFTLWVVIAYGTGCLHSCGMPL